MNFNKKITGFYRQIAQAVSLCGNLMHLMWAAAPKFTALYSVMLLVSGLLPAASAWLIKIVVDRIELFSTNMSDVSGDFVFFFVLFVSSLALHFIVNPAFEAVRGSLSDQLTYHVDQLIMTSSGKLPDLFHFEHPSFYNRLEMIQNHTSLPENMLWLLSSVMRSLVSVVSLLVLLSQIDFVVPFALCFVAIPHLLAEYRHYRRSYDVLWNQVPESRRLGYFFRTLLDPQAIQELKTLGCERYFIKLYIRVFNGVIEEVQRMKLKHARLSVAFTVIHGAGLAVMYGYVFMIAIGGRITIGDIALYLFVVNSIQASFWMLTLMSGQLVELSLQLKNFKDFLNTEPAIKILPRRQSVKLTQPIRDVEFRNVYFRYADRETDVLKDVSFSIKQEETVALVGENGAGKSTVVKLLCRFYDPAEGDILINGISIHQYDVDDLRRHISCVFQDYSRFLLTIGENIGMGEVESISNLDKIKKAAEKGQVGSFIEGLPDKYDTFLGKQFQNGMDLSGGEWHKIAGARAFMRNAELLILDEPTASLDAEAEHAIFKRFQELSRGKATLLISHRFSTISMADRILVMEGGSIIEEGTHWDLMKHEGRYARLFRMQAEPYS